MKREYTDLNLATLKNETEIIVEDGLEKIIKPIPNVSAKGVLDPKYYAEILPGFEKDGGAETLAFMSQLGQRSGEPDGTLTRMVNNGVKSLPITDGVETIHLTTDNQIPLRLYRKNTKLNAPVLYYIHGGSFSAGQPEVVEELCKLFVEKTGFLAVQIDYRLAPENPFPTGLQDCFEGLTWVYQNIQKYQGDPQKITIAGDSAGGNLAAVCSMMDRDQQTKMVHQQVLYYPSVNMSTKEDENLNYQAFDFKPATEQKDLIEVSLEALRLTASDNLGYMLKAENLEDPYLSPYLGELQDLPATLLIVGEFDYLRIEDEAFARKLNKANVPVKIIEYRGLGHGFADKIGVWAQAEDSVDEMIDFVENGL